MEAQEQNVAHDLEVIDFLLHNNKISREEASFMRKYVQSLI